jgi:hypothetical protein
MESCLKVRTKEGTLIPFALNPFQRRLVEAIQTGLRERGEAFLVVLKGRQLGVSTVCRAYMLWRALHREGQRCLMAAHADDAVRQSMGILRDMVNNMSSRPRYPAPEVASESRLSWKHSRSGIHTVLPAGKSEGRGTPVNVVHCTEVDYYDQQSPGTWARFKAGILPALNVRGCVFIVESTCQGRRALYDLYGDSLGPESRWRSLFFPWHEEPTYVTSRRYELTEREQLAQQTYQLSDGQIHFWAGFARECGELAALREYPFCVEDAFSLDAVGARNLITADQVRQAMSREPWPLQESEPVVLGLDPSRLRDASGVAVRQGKNLLEVAALPPMGDMYDLAEAIRSYLEGYRVSLIYADSGGLGGPFVDILQRITSVPIAPVDFNGKPDDPTRYYNRRAEMYDRLRKWLAGGGYLHGREGLASEILAIEVSDRREGKLLLEPKHKLSKSPNMADACALTLVGGANVRRRELSKPIQIKPWK